MYDVLSKGWLIGLMIAAPVGPIGLLCIRRSLRDGPFIGLCTGMGAASADCVYGIVAATGLALSGLLLSHGQIMGVCGGALIVYLGITTFLRGLKEPGHEAAKTEPAKGEPLKAYATTFFLTLTNPATILAFVGMISGLSAGAASSPSAPYWLVSGVFLGSASWWLILVSLTVLIRGLMSDTILRLIDFISGAILTLWGLWMIGRVALDSL